MSQKRNYEEELTYSERCNVNYEKGRRLGGIQSLREILMRVLKGEGKKQKYKVSENLFRKIKYETDSAFLEKLIFTVLHGDISVKEAEEKYEEIFRTEEEIKTEKYTIYHKYNENDK